MVVNIVFGIGITALAGALATVAGSAEDTESNIGSQGDPNSQVQLAPQMGFVHRIFNKAVAGEPPAYGLWCALGAGLAWAFLAMQVNAVLAIVLGSILAVFVQGVYATTAYLGRTASLSKFGQPVYVDILKSMTSVAMAHAFVAVFCTCHHLLPDQRRAGTPVPAAAARVHLGYHTRCSRIGNRKPVLRQGTPVPEPEVRCRCPDLGIREHRPVC